MVSDKIDLLSVIVKEELGDQTGDVRWKTADGKWWKPYEGEIIGTGDEIKTLYMP